MATNYNAMINITAQFSGQQKIDQANQSLRNLDKTTKGISAGLAGASRFLGAFGAALGAQQVLNFGKSVIDLGDNLNDLRQKTGVSVETLSGLKVAAEQGGLSFEGLQGSLRKFTNNIALANAGTLKSRAGFEALGITLRNSDGALKSSDALLLEVADKFSRMPDGANKAALAIALFGKSGTDLIPVLNGGRDALTEFSGAFSTDFAIAADRFNDSMNTLKLNTQVFAAGLLGQILPALNSVAEAFIDITKSSSDTGEEFSFLSDVVKGLGFVLVVAFERGLAAVDIFKAGLAQLSAILVQIYNQVANLGTLFKEIAANFGNFKGTQQAFSNFTQNASNDFKEFADISKTIGADLSANLKKRFEDTGRAYERIFSGKSDLLKQKKTTAGGEIEAPSIPGLNKGEISQREREQQAVQKFIESQKEIIALRDLELKRVTMSEAEYQKLVIQKQLEADAAKATIGFSQEGKRAYDEATQSIIAQRQALVDQQMAQEASFGQGAQEALRNYLETARNVAAQTNQLFTRAFQGMEDAFVNFVQTGKFNFADLARSIEADLIRLAYRQIIVGSLTSALGGIFGGGGAAVASPIAGTSSAGLPFGGLGGNFAFADGGIMTKDGPVPLRKYATGGIANSPQMALFGEGSTPEAFVPLPDGRRIPVAMEGGGGSNNVVVNVNVTNNGAATEQTQADNEQKKQLGLLIAGVVKSELIKQQRPGGLLSS